jgi:hypothetical protein
VIAILRDERYNSRNTHSQTTIHMYFISLPVVYKQ